MTTGGPDEDEPAPTVSRFRPQPVDIYDLVPEQPTTPSGTTVARSRRHGTR